MTLKGLVPGPGMGKATTGLSVFLNLWTTSVGSVETMRGAGRSSYQNFPINDSSSADSQEGFGGL